LTWIGAAFVLLGLWFTWFFTRMRRALILLPQCRTAYRCDEWLEIAVARAGDAHELRLVPRDKSLETVQVVLSPHAVRGTRILVVPAWTLAPGRYSLEVRGARPRGLTIVSGVADSSFHWSQASGTLGAEIQPGNFQVVGSGHFGLYTSRGAVPACMAGQFSPGMARLDEAIAHNLSVLVYTLWSGTVTHQPYVPGVDWTAPEVASLLRQHTLHGAQRLRRFGANILAVGMLDEPLLDELTSGAVEERVAVLPAILEQARRDLRSVWSSACFSTDLWAPHSAAQGCDPLHQLVNDVPCTHVFADRGHGKLGLFSALALARCASPTNRLAHATNGILDPERCKGEMVFSAYELTRNVLLSSGVASHWWLNWGGLEFEELAGLNAAFDHLGPVFDNVQLVSGGVALLWSSSEIRQRAQGPGSSGELACLDYHDHLLQVHQAALRAGYSVHIVHEMALGGLLDSYDHLLIVGQSAPLSACAVQAIQVFQARGGRLVTPGERWPEFDKPMGHRRWAPFQPLCGGNYPSPREASLWGTTYFMDAPARKWAPWLQQTLREHGARRVVDAESFDLVVQRHAAGEGWVFALLNGREELPELESEGRHSRYNLSAARLRVRLPAGHLWLLQEQSALPLPGGDWQWLEFFPGEMKTLLVAPRPPEGISVEASAGAGWVDVQVRLVGVAMVWPLQLRVRLDARELFTLHRATTVEGIYTERLPLGQNSRPGTLRVAVSSAAGELSATTECHWGPGGSQVKEVLAPVSIFDEGALRGFLSTCSSVTVVASPSHQGCARELCREFARRGLQARSAGVPEVLSKAHYPRVWPRQVSLVSPEPRANSGAPSWRVETDEFGRTRRWPLKLTWPRPRPGDLARVGARGYLDSDTMVIYEPGCGLVYGVSLRWEQAGGTARTVPADSELRGRWSRSWTRLESYRGGGRLPPQLPEAYAIDSHLVLLGTPECNPLVGAIVAGEILCRNLDRSYPGAGRAVLALAWSPFFIERQAVVVGACDEVGLALGSRALLSLLGPGEQTAR
jgi:hypothetical protein